MICPFNTKRCFLSAQGAPQQGDMQQAANPMAGMPPQQVGQQPPFMQQNNYPGMPAGFTPHMVPPTAMSGFTGQPAAQQPASAPAQVSATPDNSVVAHKLPSSQVTVTLIS